MNTAARTPSHNNSDGDDVNVDDDDDDDNDDVDDDEEELPTLPPLLSCIFYLHQNGSDIINWMGNGFRSNLMIIISWEKITTGFHNSWFPQFTIFDLGSLTALSVFFCTFPPSCCCFRSFVKERPRK